MVNLFVPRDFPDPVESLTARQFHWLVISMMAIVTPALLIVEILLPQRFPRDIVIALIVDADGLVLLYLGHCGLFRAGSVLLIATLYIIVTSAVWTAGGINTPSVNAYYIIPFLAGLLLGIPAAVGATIAIVLTGVFLIQAQSSGLMPAGVPPTSPGSVWVVHTMILALILVLYSVATGTLKRALEQAAAQLEERHRMQEAVRKSEEKFSRVFYSSPIPMGITVLADGEIVDINEAFCSTFGYTRQDIQDRKPLEVGIWAAPAEREAFVTTLHEHGSVRNRQTQYRSKTGRTGIALLSAEVIEIDGKDCVVFMSIDITDLKGAEQELVSSRNQLRRLGAHLEKVREEERAHVAREIHDQLGQELTGLKMDLSWCLSRIPAEEKALADKTSAMIGLVDETVHTVRRIATELRPGVLDDLGLIPALEWLAQEFQTRSGILCSFTSRQGDRPLDIGRTTALFRIFQETLTNAARHSRATRVDAVLGWGSDHVRLEVADNGVGMPALQTEPGESFGILGMKERAMMCGGELRIAETQGGGTTISVDIPIPT